MANILFDSFSFPSPDASGVTESYDLFFNDVTLAITFNYSGVSSLSSVDSTQRQRANNSLITVLNNAGDTDSYEIRASLNSPFATVGSAMPPVAECDISLSVFPTDEQTNGGNDGQVNLVATSSNTGIQYSLNGGAYQSSGLFTGLAPGTYTARAKDVDNCEDLKSFTISPFAGGGDVSNKIFIDHFEFNSPDFAGVIEQYDIYINTDDDVFEVVYSGESDLSSVTQEQRGRANGSSIGIFYSSDGTKKYTVSSSLNSPFAIIDSVEDSNAQPPITDFEYQEKYKGNFCDKKGDNIEMLIFRRVPAGSLPSTPYDLIFTGEDSEPINISYENTSDLKNNTVNGSGATINLIADENFELADIYAADETEWMVVIQGAFKWTGFIIPDNCYEPYASKPYPVTIQCTDRVGTLDKVPFERFKDVPYKGFERDSVIVGEILRKVGMELEIGVACNTFEANMDTNVCPMYQTFINRDAFVDNSYKPLDCMEVLKSILNRYSARLHQWNGKWQIVNVLEKSRGSVTMWNLNQLGYPSGGTSIIGSNLIVGYQYRNIVPKSGNNGIAKALAASMAYYKYGYPSSELLNGDFDDWPSANPLPDNWEIVGSMSLSRLERIDPVSGATGDFYPRINSNGMPNSFLRNIIPIQVLAGQRVSVSFDMYAPDAYSAGLSLNNVYLGVQVYDVSNNEYYNPYGWSASVVTYDIQYKSNTFKNQINVNFDIAPKDNDYDLKIGLRMPNLIAGDQFQASFNNVKLSVQSASALSKPAIGVFTRQTSKAFQTYRKEAIVLLHGDEDNNERTSQISINSQFVTVPPTTWKRAGITESKSLLEIVANSELRQHQKPYRLFTADYVRNEGYGGDRIDINALLQIDLLEARYIFMSGEFRLKSCIDTLRHAQVYVDDANYTMESNIEDYGDTELDGN